MVSILRSPRERTAIHGLLWSFSSDMGAKLAVLATAFIAVRTATPAVFGQYVALTASALMAASLWDAGTSMLLIRELAADHIGVRPAIARAIGLRLRLTWLWIAVYALSVATVARQTQLSPAVIALFGLVSLLSSGQAMLLSVLRGRFQFRSASLALNGGRWLTVGLSTAAFTAGSQGAAAVMLAAAVVAGEGLILAIAAGFCIRLAGAGAWSSAAPDREQGRAITLRRSLPYAANTIMSMIYNRFDVVIVATLASAGALERYAPASRLQDALYMIPSAIGTVVMPMVARRSRPGDRHDPAAFVHRMIALGLALALPISATVALFAPRITAVALGADYLAAAPVIRILVWFLPLAVIQAPLLGALAGAGRAADTTKIFAATFGTAMVMHLVLDPRWGAIGGAFASLSRDVVAVVVAWALAYRAGLVGRGRPHRPDMAVAAVGEVME